MGAFTGTLRGFYGPRMEKAGLDPDHVGERSKKRIGLAVDSTSKPGDAKSFFYDSGMNSTDK